MKLRKANKESKNYSLVQLYTGEGCSTYGGSGKGCPCNNGVC